MYPMKELALKLQLSKIEDNQYYYILDNSVWECSDKLKEYLQIYCNDNTGLGNDWYQDKLNESEELTGAELKQRMKNEIFNLEF